MDIPPVATLRAWLTVAEARGAPQSRAAAFITASRDAAPSARTATLKRLEPKALVFTSALWTRKVAELRENPQVSVLFHWPTLGRQVAIGGRAAEAERELSEELFAERERAHQLQTIVSRQGSELTSLAGLRERLAAAAGELADRQIACPPDWGAIRVEPDAVEFWSESADRLHERVTYERRGPEWASRLIAP